MKRGACCFLLLLCVLLPTRPSRSQQTVSDSVYYFYTNLLSADAYFRLPWIYGVTAGKDTARNIIGYSERFNCPYATTFLDSVSLFMTIDSLVPDAFAVEALPVVWTNSHPYADLTQPYYFDLVDSQATYYKDSTRFYPFAMGHTAITDTDFFVSAITYDPLHTIALLWSDSVMYSTPFSSIDENRDRSRILIDTPYGSNPAYQYYMGGTPHIVAGTPPDTLYWYPNFIWIAYVSSPSGSVAEMYPADQDPLTFYVERTPLGEINLHYTTLNAGSAQLDLLDATGRLVSTLAAGGSAPGEYNVPLPADALSSGMYFARLTAGNSSEMRRVVIAH